MKRTKFVVAVTVFTLALWGMFGAVGIAEAAAADAPDAKVEELWLVAPDFPENPQDTQFSGNPIGHVRYKRTLDDSAVEFTIERFVNDDQRVSLENIERRFKSSLEENDISTDSAEFERDDGELVEIFSYPCATMTYKTGENEDARMNLAIFIFADEYYFTVTISLAVNAAEDYGNRVMSWIKGMKFVNSDEAKKEEEEGRGDLIEEKGESGNGKAQAANFAFQLIEGKVHKEVGELVVLLECEVHEVPADIEGAIRFWSVLGQDTDENVTEGETGVYFFAANSVFDANGFAPVNKAVAFLPLESEYECQDIVFSPDGDKFLLMGGSGMRPDMIYTLYKAAAMEKEEEIAGIRASAVWVDPVRFALTRIDDIREISEAATGPFSYAWRVSVVLHDTVAGKTMILKEATDTKNYWLSEVIEDGSALIVREESVPSDKDWGDEDKTKENEIRVEVPAAG